MTTTFQKYEGLGNDFVVIDVEEKELAGLVARARSLCDRHFGIGADGVLFVLPPTTPTARARMLIVNQDGSEPEMCGNGLRCVALHLARLDDRSSADYAVETPNGVLGCRVERTGDLANVEIALGRGELRGSGEYPFAHGMHAFQFVALGNPHAVTLDSQLGAAEIDVFGPQISAAVPGGVNVEFVRERERGRFDIVVWERGVGRTLACGTGAGATAVALASAGRAPFAVPIRLGLPGGELSVTVSQALEVRLSGPARRVFQGEIS